MLIQPAISSRVRLHPRQSLVAGSRAQIPTQGDTTATPDDSTTVAGDLGNLLVELLELAPELVETLVAASLWRRSSRRRCGGRLLRLRCCGRAGLGGRSRSRERI